MIFDTHGTERAEAPGVTGRQIEHTHGRNIDVVWEECRLAAENSTPVCDVCPYDLQRVVRPRCVAPQEAEDRDGR